MDHQAGVHFENFTEVKFRDILLTGTGHRGQTFKPGQSRPNRDVWQVYLLKAAGWAPLLFRFLSVELQHNNRVSCAV